MRAQRPPGAAPCVAARAEALPFADDCFDVAMAVLSDHHWQDPVAGLREMRRVADRVVVFQWDNTRIGDFWLVRDYLHEFEPRLVLVRRWLSARRRSAPRRRPC